ncbi:MAG: DUF2059 domain-containing protein [Opitutaceae bacterium]
MKYLISVVCALSFGAAAFAAAPSQASIERLLSVTEVEKLLGTMYQQMDGMMKAGMDQALRGKTLPPEAQKLAETLRAKLMANMKQELGWDAMKDLYIQVYAESFTQEEIDGLIAFYESPAGRAFVAKMPIVMQKSMTMMQSRMGPIMQNMQRSLQEAIQEVQAVKAAPEQADAPKPKA